MAVSFDVQNDRGNSYGFYPEDIQIDPEMNGRHDLPNIDWLIADILERGQIEFVTIRKDGGKPSLVLGFSRWRAISEINERKLAPVKMKLLCVYKQVTAAEGFLLNISENRFRNPTSALDDAHNIKRLINVYAMSNEQVASVYFPMAKSDDELKEARKFVKSRIKLIGLTPEAEQAVRDGRLKETAAASIAKLSEKQQREVVKGDGPVVKPAKVAKVKSVAIDEDLRKRVYALVSDVAQNELHDENLKYIEVDRKLLEALDDYLNS